MDKWETFENKVADFLKKKYENLRIDIILRGKHDSTLPDIEICDKNGRCLFAIECKMSPSQAGQFVLITDENHHQFCYGCKNRFRQDKIPETPIIISYMNDNYVDFKNAGTKGKIIDIDTKVLSAWLANYYSINKGVKFLISGTADSIKNDEIDERLIRIIPVKKIGKYFSISACYREKKSGTSSLKSFPNSLVIDGKFLNFYQENNRTYLCGDSDSNEFSYNDINYHIGKKKEIRRKSKTANSNVIFSLELNQIPQCSTDLLQFETALKNV